jgi:hypothetical protein
MEKCNFSLTHFGGMDIAEKKGKQCYGFQSNMMFIAIELIV